MIGSRDTVHLTKRWGGWVQATDQQRRTLWNQPTMTPVGVIMPVARRPQRKRGKRRIENVELRRAVRWIEYCLRYSVARSVRVSNKDYLSSVIDAVNQTLHRSPRVDTVVRRRSGVKYRCDTRLRLLSRGLHSLTGDISQIPSRQYFNHCAGVVRTKQSNAANTLFGGNCVAGDNDVGGNRSSSTENETKDTTFRWSSSVCNGSSDVECQNVWKNARSSGSCTLWHGVYPWCWMQTF